jgi:hypothetical protein
MNLTFSNKNFNPLFYKLYSDRTKRFILSRGGGGSGKSYSTAQYMLIRAMEKTERILVVRKVGTTLKDSVWALMLDIIKSWGLNGFEINISDRTICYDKSKIIFKGMDDPEKIKSITGITMIWIEEATELEQDDFEQLNLRLRGKKNLQIILTFNPVSKTNWIYSRFYKEKDPDAIYYKTTHLHNRFIDEEYRKQLDRYKNLDYVKYQVYTLGEWGSVQTGNEFYRNFKDTLIIPSNYNKEEPLHISFDENVNPYISCVIGQVRDKNLHIIDEITQSDPFNTIKDLCATIEKKYENHSGGMFIYGDATSNKRDTKIESGSNLYYLILGYLVRFKPTLRVPQSNPPVKLRGDFINEIFFDGKAGIKVLIDTKCSNLIIDFKEVKQDSDGKKFKEKVRDKKTGISYERVGHLSDCFDYMICEMFRTDWEIYRNGGVKIDIQVPTISTGKRW